MGPSAIVNQIFFSKNFTDLFFFRVVGSLILPVVPVKESNIKQEANLSEDGSVLNYTALKLPGDPQKVHFFWR